MSHNIFSRIFYEELEYFQVSIISITSPIFRNCNNKKNIVIIKKTFYLFSGTSLNLIGGDDGIAGYGLTLHSPISSTDATLCLWNNMLILEYKCKLIKVVRESKSSTICSVRKYYSFFSNRIFF